MPLRINIPKRDLNRRKINDHQRKHRVARNCGVYSKDNGRSAQQILPKKEYLELGNYSTSDIEVARAAVITCSRKT